MFVQNGIKDCLIFLAIYGHRAHYGGYLIRHQDLSKVGATCITMNISKFLFSSKILLDTYICCISLANIETKERTTSVVVTIEKEQKFTDP